MAYNLAVGDIIQVTFEGALYNQTILNIRHLQMATLVGAGDAHTEFDGILTYFMTPGGLIDSFRAIISADYTLVNVVFQKIRPSRYAKYVKPVNLAGSDAGHANTANVAAVLTLQTDLATARAQKRNTGYIGAFHIPGVVSSQYIGGSLFPGYVTNMGLFGQQLIHNVVGATGSNYTPIIFHRNQPGTVAAATPITAFTPQPTVRTQRTRTVGKGV